MRTELIAIIGIIICLILLSAEYLWLYFLATGQDDSIKQHNKLFDNCEKMIQAILCAPTEASQNEEIDALIEYSNKNDSAKKIVCSMFLQIMPNIDNLIKPKQVAISNAIRRVDPVAYYSKLLIDDDVSKVGYACIKLAAFGATDKIDDIRELLNKKNRNLKYNAGMALSVLGDEDGVCKFIEQVQYDRTYSFRVINEVIDRYTGDLALLTKRLIDNSDEYMQTVVIKSVGKFRLPEFINMFLDGVRSTSKQYKIACVKALSYYDDDSIEHTLISLCRDNDWVVREYAIKGLGNFNDSEAIKAVEAGVKDKEWWVRQAAATSLINMDKSLKHVESVIKGYDRYASEAVKYSLYKTLDMEENK